MHGSTLGLTPLASVPRTQVEPSQVAPLGCATAAHFILSRAASKERKAAGTVSVTLFGRGRARHVPADQCCSTSWEGFQSAGGEVLRCHHRLCVSWCVAGAFGGGGRPFLYARPRNAPAAFLGAVRGSWVSTGCRVSQTATVRLSSRYGQCPIRRSNTRVWRYCG